MAFKLANLLVIFISFASLLSPTFSSIFSNAINSWCNKTPYPETCKYEATWTQDNKIIVPKQKSDFKKLVLDLALKQALKAQNHNKWLGTKCRNEKEKAAWSDCLKLYQDTIQLLNQTINPTTKCTDFDTQTWLSTSLTNIETCRAGFVELGVSNYLLPQMSNNVSKLISNTLAIGYKNASIAPETLYGYKEGFPMWVSPGDRKLLQSSSSRPNLVVAQDGSGNFRTIKAALGAAGQRSGSGRFVIHVKRGVYRENIEISKSLKNIMLVGDGLRYTIITGSRSVVGGSTTFNSATVGKRRVFNSLYLLYDFHIHIFSLLTTLKNIFILILLFNMT